MYFHSSEVDADRYPAHTLFQSYATRTDKAMRLHAARTTSPSAQRHLLYLSLHAAGYESIYPYTTQAFTS